MAVFRQLYEAGVVRADGAIVRCPENYHDDLIIDDNLKKVRFSLLDMKTTETEEALCCPTIIGHLPDTEYYCILRSD